MFNDAIGLGAKRLAVPVVLIFNAWKGLALEGLGDDSCRLVLGFACFIEGLDLIDYKNITKKKFNSMKA